MTEEFDHGGHNVVVREWQDFNYTKITGLTIDCDTCNVELAFFETDTRLE